MYGCKRMIYIWKGYKQQAFKDHAGETNTHEPVKSLRWTIIKWPKFKIHHNILRNREGRIHGHWSDPSEDELCEVWKA